MAPKLRLEAPGLDYETCWHEHALKLAGRMRSLSADQREPALVRWIVAARDVRRVVVDAQRALDKRCARDTLSDQQLSNLFLDVAIAGVLAATGRKRGEHTDADEGAIERALRSWQASSQGAAAGVVEPLRLAAMIWLLAGEAYAEGAGEQFAGDICVGMLGKGKADVPMRVATLALAELGYTDREAQRVLQLAREPGALKDRAHIRRLTRSARVS